MTPMSSSKHTSVGAGEGSTSCVVDAIGTSPPPFDESKCSDFTYCLDWMQRKIAIANATKSDPRAYTRLREISHNGGTLFGIADMMNAIGDYKSRDDASRNWRRIRERNTRTLCPGVVVSSKVEAKDMDFCTISDFLDHILPHVNGDTAESIRLARSRTATAVSTGSSLAIALTQSNAAAIAAGPSELRQMAEEVRIETEEKLINTGVASAVTISAANVKVDCQNLPWGNGCYHRVSLKKWISDFQPSGKIQTHIGKVGMTGNIHVRHNQYGADGAIFGTVIIPKAGRRASQCIERIQKSMVDPFREYNADEYYNMNAYRDENMLDPEEDPYAHMLPLVARYVDKVFIAKDVSVEDTWDGRQTTLDAFVGLTRRISSVIPRYSIKVRYEEMPDWEEAAVKPFLVRDKLVEVERVRQRTEDAKLQTAIETRKSDESRLRLAETERKILELKQQLGTTSLRIAAEYRRAEEAKASYQQNYSAPARVTEEDNPDIDCASEDCRIVQKGCMSFGGGFETFIATYLEKSDVGSLAVGDVVNLLYTLSGGDIIDPTKLQPRLGAIEYDYDKYLGGEYAVFWGWTLRPLILQPVLSVQAKTFIRDRKLVIGPSAWVSEESLQDELDTWGKGPREVLMAELRKAFTSCAHQSSGLLGLMSKSRILEGDLGKVLPGGQKLFIRSVKTGLIVHIYENQSAAARGLGISPATVTVLKQTGEPHDGEYLMQGVDSLAEWEKCMFLAFRPPVERSTATEEPAQFAVATVKIVHTRPDIPDAIDLRELRNKGKEHKGDLSRFLDDCFVRDEAGTVFTTQVSAVYKVWATEARKKHVDDMLEKVKEAFPNKAKLGFGAAMGQRKLAVQGIRLKVIYHLSHLDTDFDRFVAERLVVDCIARVHKAVILKEFAEWFKLQHGQEVAEATTAEFLIFCSNSFIRAKGVYDIAEDGEKRQEAGFICVGLKSAAANLIGTHSRSGTRPGVTFRSTVTGATIHFSDEREAAVRFNLAPEGIAKSRQTGGLVLGRYQEVREETTETTGGEKDDQEDCI